MPRSEKNGERARRPRNPGGAVNDETFVVVRAGIEGEQLLDMRRARSGRIAGIGDVVESQHQHGYRNGTQLDRRRGTGIEN